MNTNNAFILSACQQFEGNKTKNILHNNLQYICVYPSIRIKYVFDKFSYPICLFLNKNTYLAYTMD